jgi:hypothetical protein
MKFFFYNDTVALAEMALLMLLNNVMVVLVVFQIVNLHLLLPFVMLLEESAKMQQHVVELLLLALPTLMCLLRLFADPQLVHAIPLNIALVLL